MTTDDAKTYLSKREIPRLFESLMTGLMYHRPSDHIRYLIDCLQKVHDKGQENITWSSFVDIRRSKTPLPPISGNDKRRPSPKGSRPTSRTKTPKGDGPFVRIDTFIRTVEGEEVLSLDMGNIEDALVNRVLSLSRDSTVISPVFSSRPTSSRRSSLSFREESASSSSGPIKQQEPGPKTSPLPDIPKSREKVALPDIPIVLVMGAPGSLKDKYIQDQVLARYPGWKFLNTGNLIKEEIGRRGEASQKWKMTRDLLSRGEVAPEDVTVDVLLDGLKSSQSAKGIVVSGFPRNMQQVTEYEKCVCRADTVFMIDCEETSATERLLRRGKSSNRPEDSMSAIATRLNYFKAHTLAAAKFYDDQGKLVVIDGDSSNAAHDFGKSFDDLFLSSNKGAKPVGEAPPKSAASSVPPAAGYKKAYEDKTSAKEEEKPMFIGPVPLPPDITVQDTGRKPGLPDGPIIFIAGGPGCGKGTQCAKVLQRYPDFVHLSMGDIIRSEITTKGDADAKWGMITQLVSKGEMAPEDVTIDLLKAEMMKKKDATGYLIEGFPRNREQIEAFYNTIGGLNFVLLFDSDEYYMVTRLLSRGAKSGRIDDNLAAITKRIDFYKYNTLPVMKYFEDQQKLIVLDADRDVDSMFFDIANILDFAFFGGKKSDETQVDSKVKEVLSDDAAAVKIQAGFRGFLVRKQQKSVTKPTPTSDENKATSSQDPKISSQTRGGKPEVSSTSATSLQIANKENGQSSKKIEAKSFIKTGFMALKDAKKDSTEVPVQEEVIEAAITPGNTANTGETVDNPSHSKELDEAASKSKE